MQQLSEIFHFAVDYVIEIVGQLGYLGIFLLMSLESSFIPFPSEVVLVPAGYLASIGEMNAFYAFIAGTLGSLFGASINYYLSMTLGRSFILKYGKYFLLPEEKFTKLENAFLKHGKFATFVGRLIFGIRQWISIPAGLSRMSFRSFAFLTTTGAGIWVAILIALGYVLGKGENTTQMAKLVGYWMLVVIVIMSAAYFFWWTPRKEKSAI
ncbi:MAG: DedA family protein [Bdellovibrionota bacterium]